MPTSPTTCVLPPARLGFNGEMHEPNTGWQPLGSGYRAYSPVLMRFQSPDDLSPFGRGGINAYAYCGNDPGNRVDPSGRFAIMPFLLPAALGAVGVGAAVGASLVDNTGLKAVLGTVAALASMSAILAFPVNGTRLFRQFGGAKKGGGQRARKPSESPSELESRLRNAYLQQNPSVTPEQYAGMVAAMFEKQLVELGMARRASMARVLGTQRSAPVMHASQWKGFQQSTGARSRAPVQVQKDIRRNRSGSFERLRKEEQTQVTFAPVHRRTRNLIGMRFVDQPRRYLG